MNIRTLLIIPAAVAVAVLAGCGQGAASGSGSAKLELPSTEVCSAPAYISEHAPEGLCTDVVVDDDLSPLRGH